MEIDLLKVSYERIIDTIEVTLTDSNYEEYGYLKDSNGYYKYDVELEENVYFITTDVDVTQTYQHILPNPSKFTPTYSDVDKEGSGRNGNDGLMQRERIGHYQGFDVQWNIIPNTNKRINLVRILRALPPSFMLEYHDSNNDKDTTTTLEMYRSDISEDLYMFTQESQIWQGLSTSFVQFDVTPYDDGVEPSLLSEVE